jgi:TolB-like protein
VKEESSRAVFLSYASQDADAARRICKALTNAGLEVWFDQSELRGGDAWDQKIRRQIKDCALFVPIISANSQARIEGYFRREWKLAVDRTHDMADGTPFLVPVVIDDTQDAAAQVPEPFKAVQWTRLRAGRTSAVFVQRVSGLLAYDRKTPPRPDKLRGAASAEPRQTSAPLPDAKAHHGPWLWVSAGLAAVVILGLGGYLLLRPRAAVVATRVGTDSGASAPEEAVARPRIAVLPFENLSPDPNNAFFTDGMHEEILTALANGVPGLDVISRTTMDTYKGKVVTAPTLAKELHCNYVLEGSMRREGSQVRLTLQLIDARSDKHLWAQDFDRKLVNAMALESEVAGAVAAQLSVKLASGSSAPAQTTDPLVFDMFLRARAAAESATPGDGIEDWQKVLAQFDQVLRLDPTFVRAYVERIAVRVALFQFNYDTDGAGLADAHRDLAIAKRLAPQDPAVTASEASLAFAEKNYDRALELYAAAETAGLADPRMLEGKEALLFELGRYKEAAALSGQLLKLDPKNQGPWYENWFAFMELHLPQEAMRAADLAPSDAREPMRLTVRTEFTGDRAAFVGSNKIGAAEPLDSREHIDFNLNQVIDSLLYLGQYREARQIIDKSGVKTIRMVDWDWPTRRIGLTPVADLRGWQDLLLADAPAAKSDGERILRFLDSEPATKWNRWFREILRADAHLFMGDNAAAITTADGAVALTKAEASVSDRANAFVWATQIRAWAGAQDDAAARLESLSTSIPGLWTGEIVLDPVWSVPLTHNAVYIRLCARLEAQMKAMKL